MLVSRDLVDNRSFKLVNTFKSAPISCHHRPSTHPVGTKPSDLPGCLANLVISSSLCAGKFSDFFLGDWILPNAQPQRVVIQVALPGFDKRHQTDDTDGFKASQVENSFLQEARFYERDLKSLQGTVIPKYYGLWLGYLPEGLGSRFNTYSKQKVLFLITECLPSSYEDMISKPSTTSSSILALSNTSNPPPLSQCPITFPLLLWLELPAGQRDCYLALHRAGIAHNAVDTKHFRCDVNGRWRVVDFSKSYPEDVRRGKRRIKKRKVVVVDPRDTHGPDVMNGPTVQT